MTLPTHPSAQPEPSEAQLETARLAVSLTLQHEEAAWSCVAELIREHDSRATAALRANVERLTAANTKIQKWATDVADAVGFAKGADAGRHVGFWNAAGEGILSRIHQKNRECILAEKSVAAHAAQLTASAEREKRLREALEKSSVFAYISKHAENLRSKNAMAGYEVFRQDTFDAIAADYKRLESAISTPPPASLGEQKEGT